jgi:hypothetical protein
VSAARAVFGLAVRQMWRSFGLLEITSCLMAPGILAAFLADRLASTAPYGLGLGAASVLASAIVAVIVADERNRGGFAWLVARDVPRSVLPIAWFSAVTAVAAAGFVPGAVLAWLSLPRFSTAGVALLGELIAAAAAVLAAMAAGVLLGMVLPRVAAAIGAIGLGLVVGGTTVLAPPVGSVLPAAGLVLLADGRPASPASWLQAVGAAVAWSGVLLALSRATIERASL